MGRRIADLHPDDYATRIEIRTRLRELREESGLSQRRFGSERNGVEQGSISKFERTGVDQSKVSTIAGWARALGHQLTLTPTGFPNPVRWRRPKPGDHAGALLSALVDTYNVAAFGGADGWMAARAMNDLVGIRIAVGVRLETIARIQGISEESVRLTENGFADNQLVVLQRYARALARASRWRDGYLAVGLAPIGVDQPEQAPTPTLSV